MTQAQMYFQKYANSDEFYEYVKKNVTELSGGNETSVSNAITKTRECLDSHAPIIVKWKSYSIIYRNTVLGGWDGSVINQNPSYTMDDIERAGHWYHETMHACGFTHNGNSIKYQPQITKSWPYQGGYAFEDFLTAKYQPKLAGE